jgi:enediyne biosynthesis protein E4
MNIVQRKASIQPRRRGGCFPALAALAMAHLLISPLCALAAPVAPARIFQDRTTQLGLSLSTEAACWVDVDNDGWVDLVAAGVVWNNRGGTNFTKLAAGLGCVVAGDIDNDGFADLFSWSDLRLYRNQGGTNFVAVKLPALPKCVSRGACWGDFNGDGSLDLYIGGYEDWDAGITYPSLVLTNDQHGSFALASSHAEFRTRGVTACDFNQDGHLDIYVSNYRLQPNLLLLGDGTGRFKNVAPAYNAVATSPGFPGGHSIGAAWGDFDNDGYFDLFAGNFAHVDGRGDQPKSRFLRNLGPTKNYVFEDRGPCGVFYQESYATPAAGDYDNDGRLDLFFTTVYGTASFGLKNCPVLFHNDGRFAFSDKTAVAGLAELPPTYQAAWADFNHDGQLDLVAGGRLFVNRGSTNRWLGVRLEGDGRVVNRSAIGAQVRIRLKDQGLARQVEAGTGEGNQNDLTLHFGLGQQAGPFDLEVFWPNGITQSVSQVGANRFVSVRFQPGK